jgi:hypothetical protein
MANVASLLDLPVFRAQRDANGRRRPWITPARLTALANLGGSALISYGIGMIYQPAGIIAGGVLLVLLGKAASLPSFSAIR